MHLKRNYKKYHKINRLQPEINKDKSIKLNSTSIQNKRLQNISRIQNNYVNKQYLNENINLNQKKLQNINVGLIKQNQNSNKSGLPVPVIILIIFLVFGLIYVIYLIIKKFIIVKKYNQTPQNFIQKPDLTANQLSNLNKYQIKYINFNNQGSQSDVKIQQNNQFGGKTYTIQFINKINQKYSSVYYQKLLKNDSYFQIQILSINSNFQIGFVNQNKFKDLQEGKAKSISRIGFSIDNQGTATLLGETKYKFKWNIVYGDVIGIGITKILNEKRIWITKNGVLLNPPTSQQISKWISTEQESKDFKELYSAQYELQKYENQLNAAEINKKNIQLNKMKIVLPDDQFKYYAVIWSWQLFERKQKKTNRTHTSFQHTNKFKNYNKSPTIIKINVGGKIFRIRDNNLKSGLLADPYQKIQWLKFPFICC